MKKIEDYLVQLGLSDIEAKLYEGLIKTGPTTVREIAQHVNINRVTAHFQINNLINKGLVVQTIHGSRRQILAEPPERLRYLIEQKLISIQTLQNRFPDLLKTLEAINPQEEKAKEVEIKYYEGYQAVMNIYSDALESNEFRAYVNCHELSQVFPNNVDLFLKTHARRKNMLVWEIMEESIESKLYIQKMPKERYFYKFIPKGMNLSVIDYMIFDGKVAIVNLEKNTTGVVISNEHYYNNAKALFEFVWQMLPN